MSKAKIKLGFLDKSPVRSNLSLVDALHESIDTAEALENAGYGRYWFAEHHNNPRFGCAAPEIMISQILARTRKIKVGSGGIMLSNYAPYKIAEMFSTLAILYPGRVELGFGLGHGMEPSLLPLFVQKPDDLSRQVKEEMAIDLIGMLRSEKPGMQIFLRNSPMIHGKPDLWMLGLSEASAEFAGKHSVNYCYGHLQGGPNQKPLEVYRKSLQDRNRETMVAVHIVSARNEVELELHSKNLALGFIPNPKRMHSAWPSREESMAALINDRNISALKPYVIFGTEDEVRMDFLKLIDSYAVRNILIETIGFDFSEKIRILKVLADQVMERNLCAV